VPCLASKLTAMLIGIEIMLNAAILALWVVGSLGNADGQVFALFIIAMTSAEVSLALALVVYLHVGKTVDSDEFHELGE
jgi:NADH-quinone oxidoreductase subunit K